MAVLSYFRPQLGLLALAALVPLGQVGSRALDSQMRGAEALVLAFLAGALVRGWTLREFRSFPSTSPRDRRTRFSVSSWLHRVPSRLWFMQIQRDFAWPFARDVLAYASHDYLTSFRGFGMIFRAMLLLEGVALLLFTCSIHARRARSSPIVSSSCSSQARSELRCSPSGRGRRARSEQGRRRKDSMEFLTGTMERTCE